MSRVGLGLQFTPVSRVSYRAVQDGETTALPGAPVDTVRYRVNYEGNGGLRDA